MSENGIDNPMCPSRAEDPRNEADAPKPPDGPPHNNGKMAAAAEEPPDSGRRRRASRRRRKPASASNATWIPLRTSPDGRKVDGILEVDGVGYDASFGREPREKRMRLLARIAYVPEMIADLAARLLACQAELAFSRWEWDSDSGLLALDATGHVAPGANANVPLPDAIVRDLGRALQDKRVDALLGLAKARTCGRPSAAW